MKFRCGFVSNSSSSSFAVSKSILSDKQIQDIYNHFEVAKEYIKTHSEHQDQLQYYCTWTITETEGLIRGITTMDNFSMSWFLTDVIGIKSEEIHIIGGDSW